MSHWHDDSGSGPLGTLKNALQPELAVPTSIAAVVAADAG
jgi:hypothetical protein